MNSLTQSLITKDILDSINYDEIVGDDLTITYKQDRTVNVFCGILKTFLMSANKYAISGIGRTNTRANTVNVSFNGSHIGTAQQYGNGNYLVSIQIGGAIPYEQSEGIRMAALAFLAKFTSHDVQQTAGPNYHSTFIITGKRYLPKHLVDKLNTSIK